MSEMQAQVGNTLMQSMLKLREQKGGQISMEDMGAIFQQIASSMLPQAGADNILREEILRMAQYIDATKAEIVAMKSGDSTATSGASLELDAVVKTTEEASNAIMDAADAIQNAAAGVGGEKEAAILEAATKIYEACNFQDLTGQRINKVLTMLKEIDMRVHKLVELFGNSNIALVHSANTSKSSAKELTDKDLLNGPQLPGGAPDQAEIDKLFASFK